MKNLTLLKNNLLQKKRQRGLTLVEVGLAVLISAIIIIGVMYMYKSSSANASVYQFNNDLTSIRAGANGYFKSTGSISGLDMTTLISGGYVVLGTSKNGVGANPWGGNYVLTPDSAAGQYKITASSLSDAACSRLPAQWTAQGGINVSCTGNTFSATFNLQ